MRNLKFYILLIIFCLSLINLCIANQCTVSNCCRGECPAGQRCYNGNCVNPDENTADAQWVCENCQSVDCEVTSGPVCGIDGSTRCHKLSRPNLGFEYSTTPFCCNAYFGQEYVTWRRTETRDPSYQPPFPEDPNDIMCCNELRDCAYNGVCYPIDYAIDSTYDGRIDSICASPKVWADCDAAEVVWNKCGYPGEQWNVGRGNANADGGFSLTKGCGDDPGEYYKCNSYNSSDCACCNSNNSIVQNGECLEIYNTSTINEEVIQPYIPSNIYSWILNLIKILGF